MQSQAADNRHIKVSSSLGTSRKLDIIRRYYEMRDELARFRDVSPGSPDYSDPRYKWMIPHATASLERCMEGIVFYDGVQSVGIYLRPFHRVGKTTLFSILNELIQCEPNGTSWNIRGLEPDEHHPFMFEVVSKRKD